MSTKREQRAHARGYYGIGIWMPKTPPNVGTLWRSAASLGAAYTFQIGQRYNRQASDTVKTWKKIPHYVYESAEQFFAAIPHSCVPIAVEITDDAHDIETFHHPDMAVYLLGAEDHGIPERVIARCARTVVLPGLYCLNVAAAGTVVMYDRVAKINRTRPLAAAS